MNDGIVDLVVFTEVLGIFIPLNYHSHYLKLIECLKIGGLLYLTTPNICSVGKRMKLLFGKSPLGKVHIREYTIQEIYDMLIMHGFKLIKKGFSLFYNLTPHYAKHRRDYKENLLKIALKYPTKWNVFSFYLLFHLLL